MHIIGFRRFIDLLKYLVQKCLVIRFTFVVKELSFCIFRSFSSVHTNKLLIIFIFRLKRWIGLFTSFQICQTRRKKVRKNFETMLGAMFGTSGQDLKCQIYLPTANLPFSVIFLVDFGPKRSTRLSQKVVTSELVPLFDVTKYSTKEIRQFKYNVLVFISDIISEESFVNKVSFSMIKSVKTYLTYFKACFFSEYRRQKQTETNDQDWSSRFIPRADWCSKHNTIIASFSIGAFWSASGYTFRLSLLFRSVSEVYTLRIVRRK